MTTASTGHTRIERLLSDGSLAAEAGTLPPNRDRPGIGLTLERADADRFRRC